MPSNIRCIPTRPPPADPSESQFPEFAPLEPPSETVCFASDDDSWRIVVPETNPPSGAGPSGWVDPEWFMDLIRNNGNWRHLRFETRRGDDRSASISLNARSFRIEVTPDNRYFREIALYATQNDPWFVLYLGSAFLDDPSFLIEAWSDSRLQGGFALVANYHLFLQSLSLPASTRDVLLRETATHLREIGLSPLSAGEAIHLARLTGGASRGRVRSLTTLFEVTRNISSLEAEGNLGPVDRPIAAVMVARDDWNGAFTDFPVLDTLVESGAFHLFYSEVSDERDILARLEQIHRETGREIHTLILGGHGTAHSILLDPENPGYGVITFSDFLFGDFARLHSLLAADGQVLLWSCSNGAGGAEAFNLANFMSRAVPGREIISYAVPSHLSFLRVGEDLRLDVTLTRDDPLYVAIASE